MIFDSIITGLLNILKFFIDLLPSIPRAASFDDSWIIGNIEAVGYLLPIQSMIATFGLWFVIKRWELVVSTFSWIWEKIPFN